MILEIFKSFKIFRSLVSKFVSSGKKDPEAFIEKVKDWHKELGEKLAKAEKKKDTKKDEKKDEENDKK